MDKCVVLNYKKNNSFKISVNKYKVNFPDVIITEFITSKNIIAHLRLKKILNDKNYKNLTVFDLGKDTNKYKLINKNLILVINSVSKIYGYEIKKTEIGIVLEEYNEQIYDMIEKVSKICRCVKIYEKEDFKFPYRKLYLRTGTCVVKGNNSINEKIIICFDKEISIIVGNKTYFDIKLIYNNEKLDINEELFDIVFRCFSCENDIQELLNKKIVKKMALMSK